MKKLFVERILEVLERDKEALKKAFNSSGNAIGTRYCYIENLLPEELALKINSSFPEVSDMRLMDSFREKKFTTKDFDKYNKILSDITFAIQDKSVIKLVEYITGIKEQIPDDTLYAGGLSSMTEGCFLNPHIDNSHEMARINYRTLNLLYYITPHWKEEYGGNLELWNNEVNQNLTITSKFNRLVLMETNPTSWHSVSPVMYNGKRNCVSNYYFSPISPTGSDYFNITAFSARPEQKFRRALAKLDSSLRGVVRKFVPKGLGKKDIYKKGRK